MVTDRASLMQRFGKISSGNNSMSYQVTVTVIFLILGRTGFFNRSSLEENFDRCIIYLFIYLFIYLSIYLSIYLFIYLFIY